MSGHEWTEFPMSSLQSTQSFLASAVFPCASSALIRSKPIRRQRRMKLERLAQFRLGLDKPALPEQDHPQPPTVARVTGLEPERLARLGLCLHQPPLLFERGAQVEVRTV